MTMFEKSPRGLREQAAVRVRLRMLQDVEPIQSLKAWAEDLATRRNVVVPHFDPGDAGAQAKVLILLEAPGPMTNGANPRPGSGFISVDNDDKTAENCWTLRDDVGLSERETLQWNIVPWYLGPASVKPNAAELREGGAELIALMELLPDLQVVIASGLYAQKGWRMHVARERRDLHLIETWHPSPLALNQPGKRDAVRGAFAEAVACI